MVEYTKLTYYTKITPKCNIQVIKTLNLGSDIKSDATSM